MNFFFLQTLQNLLQEVPTVPDAAPQSITTSLFSSPLEDRETTSLVLLAPPEWCLLHSSPLLLLADPTLRTRVLSPSCSLKERRREELERSPAVCWTRNEMVIEVPFTEQLTCSRWLIKRKTVASSCLSRTTTLSANS